MYLLILLGALLFVALLLLGVRELVAADAERRRAVSRAEHARIRTDEANLLEIADARFRTTRLGRALEHQLDLAGVNRPPLHLFLGGVVVTLVATVVLWRFFAPILALAGVVVGVLVVRWFLDREQTRRREAFVGQLPELARVLANASYAGLSLPTAIGIAGEELAEPARTELRRVSTQLKFGAPLATALGSLRERVGSRETNVLMSTLIVAARSGGSLVTALRDIAETLDQRKETRREVQSILAQAVATSYMVILLGGVMLLSLNVLKPGTVEKMTTNIVGQVCLSIAVLLFGGGFLAIRRMTRVEP
ncbi:type II secretion system F family protein [Janibacter sp. G56]|uniref:type II secretion system F family protein n=1 Tax=Janibacter sp. G56 TaxID=3418717 RepID=UPI003D019C16